jgi:hypothetical protein
LPSNGDLRCRRQRIPPRYAHYRRTVQTNQSQLA